MKDRVKRKITWENQGVSEIIGTILMLMITVVLFSTIITWVGQLPPPRESFHVDLAATLDPVNATNWSEGVWLNIRHQGGQDMGGLLVSLFITVDAVTLEKALDEGGDDVDTDNEWSVGETWSLLVTTGEVVSLKGPLPASVFKILIINNEKNAIIWTHTLGEAENHYAPIVLDAWIDSDLGTVVDDPGPISYTEPFKFYARIVDPEGYDPIYGLNLTEGEMWVDLSNIDLSDHVNLTDVVNETAYPEYSGRDALHDNVYVAICEAPDITVNPGYYFFWVHAVDRAGEEVKRAVRFPVGMIVGDNPQIYVNNIDFSDEEPVNGDIITIYADIRNIGGAGSRVDVCFYDVTNNNTLINLNNESILISVAAMGQSEARVSWKASPGGVHVINVTAYVHVNETKTDPDLTDNYLEKPISVMPKILLVDDDNAMNDQSSTDTVSFMRASLEAADFAYDFYLVGAGDGPGYDYGDNYLEEYDVVIWMTGYEESNTLTETDRKELKKYLQPSASDNGGSFWLISQGYFREGGADPDLLTFAQDCLHVQSPEGDGLPSDLYGNDTHPDASYPTNYLANNPLVTINRISSTDLKYTRSYYWTFANRDADNVALYDNLTDYAYALTYNSTAELNDTIIDSRLFIQPWEFSRIKDTSAQAQYTYKVILWLGNITKKLTRDVAISEQTVEPEVVFYKQKVTISFIIRNNGFSPYDVNDTSSPDLEFLLRITDVYGQKDLVTPFYGQVSLGTGLNNTVTVEYPWIPEEVGYHRLIIKVDPYDRIDESNELNNEISDFLSSGELNVQFRVLVVDDDGSVNNNGPYVDETLEVTTALDMLNYSYEIYTVNHTKNGPAFDGEDNSLNKYNAVLWVIGGDLDVIPSLTIDDQDNITEYLKIGGCLWLIGDGLWKFGDTTNTFEQDFLRIDSVIGDQDTPTMLNGPRDDEVSHGMAFSGSGGSSGDILVNTTDGIGFFYQDSSMTAYNSVRYEGPPVVDSDATCKVATTAWLLSSLDSNESKAELVFMMLRWFDKPEDRIEARITDYDIWLSDAHPQLGSGYVIQATVHNTGGSLGNVLVRFMDGNDQIGSYSIGISPGESTTAEMVWIPLYAGQRTLSVLVDPILEVDEIFEWSNNNATLSTYVYFFWDDMESGSGKWAHSSTVLLINGEGPLEYFYETQLDTDIITQWDNDMSIGLKTTEDHYHSFEGSYWLQEPVGGGGEIREPMDVVMVIDTSDSMEMDQNGTPVPDTDPNQRLYQARAAANHFIDLMSDQDRLAIYQFDNVSSPERKLDFLNMDIVGRAFAHLVVNNSQHQGLTPIWDTIHEAIDYSGTNSNLSSVAAVLVLTDGNDTSSGMDPIYWPSLPYTDNDGDPTDDWQAGTIRGVCEAPMSVFTVGLLVPGGEFGNATNEEGPMLNETAISSNPSGKFYYAPDPADLEDIFELIFGEISEQLTGENQTRSGEPAPQPNIAYAFNYDFQGVTQASGPHDGYYTDFDKGVPVLNDWDLGSGGISTEIANVDYQYIGTDNGITWEYDTKTTKYYRFHYQISEDPADVTRIDATINYQSEDTWSQRFYIWNNATGIWEVLATSTSTTDQTLTGSIITNIADYIDASNKVYTAFTHLDPPINQNKWIRMDYTNITIIGDDSVPPEITVTSPADGDNGVATNAQVVIDFSEVMNTASILFTCSPDPTGWGAAWENGDTRLRLTHAGFPMGMVITFDVTQARDKAGNDLVGGIVPNPWSFETIPDTVAPFIVVTSPANGVVNVPLDVPVIIVFNETMNRSSVTYACTPVLIDPGGWSAAWSANDTVLTLTHNTFVESTPHIFTVTYAEDLVGNPLVVPAVVPPDPVPNPWTFTTWTDMIPPIITYATPYNGEGGVRINQPIKIRFSEPMETSTVAWGCIPNPGNWVGTWSVGNTVLTLVHSDFGMAMQYNFWVVGQDLALNDLGVGAVPSNWFFTTGMEAIPRANFNKTAVTGTMNLENLESAKLSFWHKYNIMPGANGGFLQVGYNDSGTWKWKYIIPANAYTGNLRASVIVNDDFGQRIYWCWNGLSGRGTFGWEPIKVELLNYVPDDKRDQVKVKFNYTQYGGGTGYGWYLDDVRVTVSRSNSVDPVNDTAQDIWNLTDSMSHSGDHSWANFNATSPDDMKPGLDNYLMSMPIDLTNARIAFLSAYVKFNLNDADGAPPDGFRVEVTKDNGITWEGVNMGVRSSWGVSGTGQDIEDGMIDGMAYTGLPDSGNPADAAIYGYWVEIGTLSRVKVDLSAYSGHAIQIRFRVVTCNHPLYLHNNHYQVPDPGFGGFYIDDVIVMGETIRT